MSESKPKPGSLRDRIAAFEKKPDQTSAPAPVPRPKPGNLQWKPKAASPPSSPPATTDTKPVSGGGMSASDAKESIGKGGSLRERMAALQGKGAFGGQPSPPLPIPPKPAVDRPKWKPSPSPKEVVVESEETEETEVTEESLEPVKEDEPESDPEEEERQRRAALAARMARLGGARVGMGPPVFGKQTMKKVQHEGKSLYSTHQRFSNYL